MFGYGNQQGGHGQQQGGYGQQQGSGNRPQRGGGGGISPGLLVTIGVVLLLILSKTGAIDSSLVVKILVGVVVAFFVIPTFIGGGRKGGGKGQGGQQGGQHGGQQGGYNQNNRW